MLNRIRKWWHKNITGQYCSIFDHDYVVVGDYEGSTIWEERRVCSICGKVEIVEVFCCAELVYPDGSPNPDWNTWFIPTINKRADSPCNCDNNMRAELKDWYCPVHGTVVNPDTTHVNPITGLNV